LNANATTGHQVRHHKYVHARHHHHKIASVKLPSHKHLTTKTHSKISAKRIVPATDRRS
jgi:hypothetical protein